MVLDLSSAVARWSCGYQKHMAAKLDGWQPHYTTRKQDGFLFTDSEVVLLHSVRFRFIASVEQGGSRIGKFSSPYHLNPLFITTDALSPHDLKMRHSLSRLLDASHVLYLPSCKIYSRFTWIRVYRKAIR